MNHRITRLCLATLSLGFLSSNAFAENPSAAAHAVNALGLDLLAKGGGANANALLSPYSIQCALAMTFAGAAGETRTEMARVLHYQEDEKALHKSFTHLQQALGEVAKSTAEISRKTAAMGGSTEPFTLTVANRLFGQQDYEFRQPFLDLVKEQYAAPLQLMDFIRNAEPERLKINRWVEEQTHDRIRDLIPNGALSSETRLVLVNAIHLKAPWADKFPDTATKPLPFHTGGAVAADVPTMRRVGRMGYDKRDGYQAVTIPYIGGDMQLLVLLPDAKDGLAGLEAKLTPAILTTCANPGHSEIDLSLPRFKLEPPLMELSKLLVTLGMQSAFNQPRGSANFDRMAPRKPDDYLFISEVFHKTFLALDEKGTEAAAATAVVMDRSLARIDKPKPVEVRVDHPFLFAIQHRPSGACLFLGRVTDPR
jgi:serpin B